MPTRNVVQSARNANAELQIRFYFGDAAADPPNAPRVEVILGVDDPSVGRLVQPYDRAVANTTLTPAQRTALVSALTTLRDEAVAALGFV